MSSSRSPFRTVEGCLYLPGFSATKSTRVPSSWGFYKLQNALTFSVKFLPLYGRARPLKSLVNTTARRGTAIASAKGCRIQSRKGDRVMKGLSENVIWDLAPKFDQCLRQSEIVTLQPWQQEIRDYVGTRKSLVCSRKPIFLFGGGEEGSCNRHTHPAVRLSSNPTSGTIAVDHAANSEPPRACLSGLAASGVSTAQKARLPAKFAQYEGR